MALHDLGIIHRDIKPDNIMLGNDGFVRIADLESAVYTGGKPLENNNCKGTRGFTAPEMLGRAPIDHRVDIFSLGALISYLTGNIFTVFPVADIIQRCTAFYPDKRFRTVREVRDQILGIYMNTFPDISCYFENI
jgi:serine/threonine protein kinase